MTVPPKVHQYYNGTAPGDLIDVPNQHVETWLTDPTLILIFMEIIPGIAAVLIFLMSLTVMAVGFSLVIRHIKYKYAERLRIKLEKKKVLRRRVKRRKRAPELDSEILKDVDRKSATNGAAVGPQAQNAAEIDATEDGDSGVFLKEEQQSRANSKRGSRFANIVMPSYSKAKEIYAENGVSNSTVPPTRSSSNSSSSAEVGILTGTKRKPKSKSRKHRKKAKAQKAARDREDQKSDEEKKPKRRKKTYKHLPKFLQKRRNN